MTIIHKAARVTVLDSEGASMFTASGFFVHDGAKCCVFTCWHVVTGVDPFDPEITASLWPPKRRQLKVSLPQFIASGTGPSRGFSVSMTSVTLPLYEESSGRLRPLWFQERHERPHPDLSQVGLRIPMNYDLVAIPIQLSADTIHHVSTDRRELLVSKGPVVGPPVHIVGFPYGYGAGVDFLPQPIVLTRYTATYGVTPSILLDGTGVPGMSGAPVFIDVGRNDMKLIGCYTGSIFPDAIEAGKAGGRLRRGPDLFAALGVLCPHDAIDEIWGTISQPISEPTPID
jgi:hypothetical protein